MHMQSNNCTVRYNLKVQEGFIMVKLTSPVRTSQASSVSSELLSLCGHSDLLQDNSFVQFPQQGSPITKELLLQFMSEEAGADVLPYPGRLWSLDSPYVF